MRQVEEKTFRTHDGVDLFYRHWPAVTGAARGAIVMFHRGHEHSGRMAHLADELDLPDFAVFAWDARGQGRSPGERGFSPSLGTSVRDVQTFVDHIETTYGIAATDIAVVAQSLGAVLVAAWAHDYAPGIRCMVLASPAFRVKLYVPFARTGLKILHKLRGHFFVNSYVKAGFLTHDPERIKSFNADPLIARPIAVNILLAVYETADRVVADARAITIPTQLLISGADFVVHHGPQHRFFERLGSAIKERHVLPGFYHDTFGEKDRAIAVDKARSVHPGALRRACAPAVAARIRPRELHARRSRRAGVAAAAAVAARAVLGRGAAEHDDRRPLLRRHAPRPSHRLRLRLDARLRLSQRAGRARSTRTPDRQDLSASRSGGAASASGRSISRSCCAPPWSGW